MNIRPGIVLSRSTSPFRWGTSSHTFLKVQQNNTKKNTKTMSKVAPGANSTTTGEKGYLLTFVKITDPDGFKAYPPMVPATLCKYEGKMVVKGALNDAVYSENEGRFALGVLIEFPSEEKALSWYHSEEYKEPKALRQKTSEGPFVIGSGPDMGDYKGFLLAFFKIVDNEGMSKYSAAASLIPYQGKFIMKATEPKVSEEFDDYDLGGLIAFPTVDLAEAWMASDEYREMKAIRVASATGPVVILGTN